jgi:hypothetical protein
MLVIIFTWFCQEKTKALNCSIIGIAAHNENHKKISHCQNHSCWLLYLRFRYTFAHIYINKKMLANNKEDKKAA